MCHNDKTLIPFNVKLDFQVGRSVFARVRCRNLDRLLSRFRPAQGTPVQRKRQDIRVAGRQARRVATRHATPQATHHAAHQARQSV